MKSVRIIVQGRVQGVGFRNTVRNYCARREIFGSVMNLDDGSVLIMAQSSGEALNELLNWLKSSPGFSKVESVKMSDVKMNERFYEFNVVKESSVLKDKGKALGNLGKKIFGKR